MTALHLAATAAAPRRRPASAPLALPPTEWLLAEGGDARIALVRDGAADGPPLNRYACATLPDPGLAAFGSATASTVSERGFEAADRLRHRLAEAASRRPEGAVHADEAERIRSELAALNGLADLAGLDIVLAASGTDLHLLLGQLLGGAGGRPCVAIMAEPSETGGGVPAALRGRHFSTRAALGETVTEGSTLGAGCTVAAVPIRAPDGTFRSAGSVAAEIEELVRRAAADGRRVLLTLLDVSKTGAVAPAPALAEELQRRWPDQLEILVDACQFRLAPVTLRAYLKRGWMVAVTGSKFLTGPAFSGALLVPDAAARRLRTGRLGPALAAYSARADWPAGWAAGRALGEVANFGLLLRWEAALAELRAFRAVPEAAVASFLADFAAAVTHRLAEDPAFAAPPAPSLDRGPDAAAGWDRLPTIFPFLLRDRGGLLAAERVDQVYRWLRVDAGARLGIVPGDPAGAAAALRGAVGQPVLCGSRDGATLRALRLCASARLVVEATARPDGARRVIGRALAVLDKAALLVRRLAPPG